MTFYQSCAAPLHPLPTPHSVLAGCGLWRARFAPGPVSIYQGRRTRWPGAPPKLSDPAGIMVKLKLMLAPTYTTHDINYHKNNKKQQHFITTATIRLLRTSGKPGRNFWLPLAWLEPLLHCIDSPARVWQESVAGAAFSSFVVRLRASAP